MTVIVTGASGFIGSHFCEALLARGEVVVGFGHEPRDTTTSTPGTAPHTHRAPRTTATRTSLARHGNFIFVAGDVTESYTALRMRILDAVMRAGAPRPRAIAHLASPAGTRDFIERPWVTVMANTVGTANMITLAESFGARFLLASSGEVYGETATTPQREHDTFGPLDPSSPRAPYEEGKRAAEMLTRAAAIERKLDTRIARIFMTYGPRMSAINGGAVMRFIHEALAGQPLTVNGDGSQTRALCYVTDLVDGLTKLLDADNAPPIVNLGNDDEVSIRTLADRIIALTESPSRIEFQPLPHGDPPRRRPDLTLARTTLAYAPSVSLDDGLTRLIRHLQ